MTDDRSPRTAAHDAAVLHRRTITTPIGPITLVAGDRGLRAVLLPDERPDRIRLAAVEDSNPPPKVAATLDLAATQLAEYFAGTRKEFALDLDPVGTPFQLRAWQALRAIPYGDTRSYREQAAAIGSPSAVRAVGAANGRNPLSIIVPCHRVVGADGSLTGYAGGVSTKRRLLELEAGESSPQLFDSP